MSSIWSARRLKVGDFNQEVQFSVRFTLIRCVVHFSFDMNCNFSDLKESVYGNISVIFLCVRSLYIKSASSFFLLFWSPPPPEGNISVLSSYIFLRYVHQLVANFACYSAAEGRSTSFIMCFSLNHINILIAAALVCLLRQLLSRCDYDTTHWWKHVNTMIQLCQFCAIGQACP